MGHEMGGEKRGRAEGNVEIVVFFLHERKLHLLNIRPKLRPRWLIGLLAMGIFRFSYTKVYLCSDKVCSGARAKCVLILREGSEISATRPVVRTRNSDSLVFTVRFHADFAPFNVCGNPWRTRL